MSRRVFEVRGLIVPQRLPSGGARTDLVLTLQVLMHPEPAEGEPFATVGIEGNIEPQTADKLCTRMAYPVNRTLQEAARLGVAREQASVLCMEGMVGLVKGLCGEDLLRWADGRWELAVSEAN